VSTAHGKSSRERLRDKLPPLLVHGEHQDDACQRCRKSRRWELSAFLRLPPPAASLLRVESFDWLGRSISGANSSLVQTTCQQDTHRAGIASHARTVQKTTWYPPLLVAACSETADAGFRVAPSNSSFLWLRRYAAQGPLHSESHYADVKPAATFERPTPLRVITAPLPSLRICLCSGAPPPRYLKTPQDHGRVHPVRLKLHHRCNALLTS
jgi:hypothetical protein